MKRPKARKGPSETSGRRPPEITLDLGRVAPRLVIELPLEELGRVQIQADSHEDEVRLRLWLRHCRRLPSLVAAIERYLDDLDGREVA